MTKMILYVHISTRRTLAIHFAQVLYGLCVEYKVAVISIKLPKGSYRLWEMVKHLVKDWKKVI